MKRKTAPFFRKNSALEVHNLHNLEMHKSMDAFSFPFPSSFFLVSTEKNSVQGFAIAVFVLWDQNHQVFQKLKFKLFGCAIWCKHPKLNLFVQCASILLKSLSLNNNNNHNHNNNNDDYYNSTNNNTQLVTRQSRDSVITPQQRYPLPHSLTANNKRC